MRKKVILIFIIILGGCTALSESFSGKAKCQLEQHQMDIVVKNIRKVIEKESTEKVTFRLSQSLLEKGKLSNIKLKHNPQPEIGVTECWAYLSPVSKVPGMGILDGDGGVYIHMDTLETGYVFWFSW